jgi:hypothetical protein
MNKFTKVAACTVIYGLGVASGAIYMKAKINKEQKNRVKDLYSKLVTKRRDRKSIKSMAFLKKK